MSSLSLGVAQPREEDSNKPPAACDYPCEQIGLSRHDTAGASWGWLTPRITGSKKQSDEEPGASLLAVRVHAIVMTFWLQIFPDTLPQNL